jgi:hypothetical protein
MHVHPPKAVEGWKDFTKEIVIIVIGVLIALGFEQIVEEMHWHYKIEDAHRRLAVEDRQLYLTAIERVVMAPCIMGQYDRLRDRVLSSGDRLQPAPLYPVQARMGFAGSSGAVIRMSGRMPTPAVWDALHNDGTFLHIPAIEQRRLAILYRLIDAFGPPYEVMPTETLAQPVPLDASGRIALLENISATQLRYYWSVNAAAQLAGNIRDLGFAPPPSDVDRFIAASDRDMLAFCHDQGFRIADWRDAVAKEPTFEQRGL